MAQQDRRPVVRDKNRGKRLRERIARTIVVLAMIASTWVASPSASAASNCSAVPKGKVPVVLVHGYAGDSGIWGDPKDKASTFHAINSISEVDASIFSYEEHSSAWVDNPAIGPELAERILCLADKSSDHKVIAVAHSMGGLALRYAASKTPQAAKVKKALGLAVTIGTPNTGSVWASMGEFFLSLCDFSNLPVLHLERPDWCIPAANGLQLDSQKLRELPMLPNEVAVQAVAGDVTFHYQLAFGIPIDVDTKSDLVVGVKSARRGHNPNNGGGETTVSCKSQLFGNPSCWHGALPSDGRVKDKTVASIKKYLSVLHAPDAPPLGCKPFKFHDVTIGLRSGWQADGSGSSDRVSVTDNAHCASGVCPSFDLWSPQALNDLQVPWQQIDPPECSVDPRAGVDKHPVTKGLAPIGDRMANYYEQQICPPQIKREMLQFWHLPSSHYLVVNQGVEDLKGVLATARWS